MLRIVFIGFLSLILVGCTSIGTSGPEGGLNKSMRLFTIYIDGNGKLLDPVSHSPVAAPGSSLPYVRTQEDSYVKAILDNFHELKYGTKEKPGDPNLKMVWFIHGGLNEFKTATSRPAEMADAMLEDHRYPVFICWDSSFKENYLDHLVKIRKGLNRPLLGPISSPFIFLEDVGRSIVRIPSSIYKEVTDPLTVSKTIDSPAEKSYNARVGKLQEEMGFNISNNGPHVGVGSDYYTVINPVKLIMAPFVDGFGTGAWDGMLRRTDLVLTKNIAFEGDVVVDTKGVVVSAEKIDFAKIDDTDNRIADTAASIFIKEFESAYINEKIDLIGHSMGAIVTVNIIARHPRLNVDNLVFMGAAAKIKDVENVVVPWLEANDQRKFWNLSLDPYREIGENYFYDFMPRGSLLNWIDFTFGDVNSFKDRTVGSWWNITRLAEDVFPGTQYNKKLRKRVYLTRFPISNDGEWPQKHGEFTHFRFWREQYWSADSAVKLIN